MTLTASTDTPPLLSFLVCTFHREDLLADCLRSLSSLEGLTLVPCEILVVDNSDDETAREVVLDMARGSPITIQYLTAHPANIAVARNRGVSAARGRFVAMIDDDMRTEPGWLNAVQPLLVDGGYDVLSGPVEPIYEDPALASRDSDAFFRRRMPVSQPTPLRIMGPARTRGFVPATSNSIFRRASCFSGELTFDRHYGKSGGEDVDVFCRLERMGRRFAWVPDALTFEQVPARRCEMAYLEKRNFVGGQIFASTYVRNARSPTWVALKVSAIAAAQFLVLYCLGAVAARANAERRRSLKLKQAAVRGKLAWRSMVPIYEQEAQAAKS